MWATRICCRGRVTKGQGVSYEFVPFPFATPNTDYSISFSTSSIVIANIGTVTMTIFEKRTDGVILSYSTDNTSYGTSGAFPLMTITF